MLVLDRLVRGLLRILGNPFLHIESVSPEFSAGVFAKYPAGDPANLIRARLWQSMRDNRELMPLYAESTRKRKRKKGLPSERYVLFETGALYKSLKLITKGDHYLVRSERDRIDIIVKRLEGLGVPKRDIFGGGEQLRDAVKKALKAAILAAVTSGCLPKKVLTQHKSIQERFVQRVDTINQRFVVTVPVGETLKVPYLQLVVHRDTHRDLLRVQWSQQVPIRRDTIIKTIIKSDTLFIRQQPSAAGTKRNWGNSILWLLALVGVLSLLFRIVRIVT